MAVLLLSHHSLRRHSPDFWRPIVPKQNCHPDRSAAKWRDLLFLPPLSAAEWKRPLPFVIPTEAQRSGGICSSADLSWRCFSTGVPGFPATHHWTGPRVRLSLKERRMKCANAAKLHRKSGVAQWRDLLFLVNAPSTRSLQHLVEEMHRAQELDLETRLLNLVVQLLPLRTNLDLRLFAVPLHHSLVGD